jgi:hypothetical protein
MTTNLETLLKFLEVKHVSFGLEILSFQVLIFFYVRHQGEKIAPSSLDNEV